MQDFPARTRFVMLASAGLLGAAGVTLMFVPDVAARAFDQPFSPLIELAGAGALALAMIDWMARNSTIGGIYGRPIVIGNLTFGVVSVATLGRLAAESGGGIVAILCAGAFAAHAAAFGWLLLSDPTRQRRTSTGS